MRLPALPFAPVVVAAIALAAGLGSARAQTAPPRSAGPAGDEAGAPAGAARSRAAIARVAEAIAAELAPQLAKAELEGRVLVVPAPPSSDAPAPRLGELAAKIAAQISGRLGKGSRASASPLALPPARALARSGGALVHVALAVLGGEVRVTADAYPVPGSVWSRVRDPSPGPVAHAFSAAPIDAEVRTFLAPVPLTAARVERARHAGSDTVALACGDVDGDGSLEIALVGRRRVSLVRLRGGRLAPIASRAWPDVAPVHPTPMRQPLAFATLVQAASGAGAAHLDVGLTDRAKSVRFVGRLEARALMDGLALPHAGGTACATAPGLAAKGAITGPLSPCAPGDPALASASPGEGARYDALASAALVAPSGRAYAVWARREAGAVELRDDAGRRASIEGAGAQLALGDLDQDGAVDLIAGLDVLDPRQDAVVVRRWDRRAAEGAAPAEWMRLPAPSGVLALAVCPPIGPGRAPFVVATTGELWVVH